MTEQEQVISDYQQTQIETIYRMQATLAMLAALMAKDRSVLLSGLHFDVLVSLTRDIERQTPTALRH